MTSTGSSIGQFEISRDRCDHGRPRDLARTQTVMEVSLCPMCTRALKIYTIEPHPTRDGVDVGSGPASGLTPGVGPPQPK